MGKKFWSALSFFLLATVMAAFAKGSLSESVPTFQASPYPYPAVVEYGAPEALLNQEGPLLAYIRFPVAGSFTDDILWQWAEETYESALKEIKKLEAQGQDISGEINVQFDSYLVDGRYAGVLESGMLTYPGLAHPLDILQTFNFDLQNEKQLQLGEILDLKRLDDILALTAAKLREDYPTAEIAKAEDSWLEHSVLMGDGLMVAIKKGLAMASSWGSPKIILSREELGSLYLLSDPTEETTLRKAIALTFDDGPSSYTEEIMEILAENNINATFFVIGNLIEAREGTVKKNAAMGNEILGHSWDHRDLTKLPAQEIEAQIMDTFNLIEATLGSSPKMYRPPYGAFNDTVKDVSRDLGFQLVHWSVDSLDWQSQDADAVYNEIMDHVREGSIILCHDLYPSTVAAMKRVIPQLLEDGYQFFTLSKFMEAQGIPFEPGKVLR